MAKPARPTEDLIDKIQALPPDKLAEVEDFVDFLRMKDSERLAARGVTELSEQAFAKVWDNPEDAAYDAL